MVSRKAGDYRRRDLQKRGALDLIPSFPICIPLLSRSISLIFTYLSRTFAWTKSLRFDPDPFSQSEPIHS